MVDSAVNDPHPCFDLPRREYCPVSHLPPAFRFYFSINFSFFPSKNKVFLQKERAVRSFSYGLLPNADRKSVV